MIVSLDDSRKVNLSQPLDISIPLTDNTSNPCAWYVDSPRFETVKANGWVGSVKEGGSVNFRDIFFNPHGHGTHTECLGHITQEVYSVNQRINQYFFNCELISVQPQEVKTTEGFDLVVSLEDIKTQIKSKQVDALVIRTTPNSIIKKSKNYSSTNPPYFDVEIVSYLNQIGVKHLLIDLPSVDKEFDNGALAFHHAFWSVPENPNHERTITEMIFVNNEIKDGLYLLNLQVAPFENDASPSRPVLYAFE